MIAEIGSGGSLFDDQVAPFLLDKNTPSQMWAARAREISRLREQGETLASIGQRFGLSAERVRQILLDEDQRLLVRATTR